MTTYDSKGVSGAVFVAEQTYSDAGKRPCRYGVSFRYTSTTYVAVCRYGS